MDIRTRINEHLRILCEEIGARPTGSKANHAAADYACKEFRRSGLHVLKQEFDCIDWIDNGSILSVEGQDIPVLAAPFSLPCDIYGELICVNSLEELRAASIEGKIVVLCGALASEALMPKSFMFRNPDEHRETISLLENGKALAVLSVSLSPECFVPVIEDGDFKVPCAIILPKSLPTLSSSKSAALALNTKRCPARAANVLASYGSGEHKVCISAHIDTKPGTPGALDNASGTAVLLALAEELSGREFPYRIEFVLFNGEDYYSNPGEMLYLSSNLSNPDEYVCAFNIDGVGVKGKNITYFFYECHEKLVDNISSLAEKTGGFELTAPWPLGDHTLFFRHTCNCCYFQRNL